VGVFADHQQAQRAVNELKRMGFTEDHIGVARRDSDEDRGRLTTPTDAGDETYAGEGTAAGLATGAGVGALWGLGILAGVLPAVGPAIAGGTLAAILSSAAAGAVAAGLGGALIGLGLSKEEADYYNTEFEAGRTVVTVTAVGREQEAEAILREYGGYDISREGSSDEGVTGMAGEGRVGQRWTGSETIGSGMAGAGTAPASTANATPNAWMAGEGTTTAGTHRGMRSESESTTMGSESAACHTTGSTGSMRNDEAQRMTAYEEQLAVDKQSVDKGDVNLRKEVHTEHKTLEVPVQREEVVIERRAPSGESSGSVEGHQEIRIPVREEQVNVQKVSVAKEDVVVGKRTVHDTQRVAADLRKEEIKVDADPDVPVRDRRDET